MSRFMMALRLMLAMVLSGCVSTEALYAEYDEVCPVQARVTDTGLVMVSAIASVVDGDLWEPAVYFGFDEDALSNEERARLDRNLAVLKQYPTLQVSVQAFTDQRGTVSYNQKLANRRLNQVVQHLRDAGISNGRIKRVALGEELPILPDANSEQRVINRRVELMPLDAQGRPLVLRADFARSGGDEFVPPAPVK